MKMNISGVLRKLMTGSSDNGKKEDDLGRAEALAAQQKVFDMAEELNAEQAEFDSRMAVMEKRISDTEAYVKEKKHGGR